MEIEVRMVLLSYVGSWENFEAILGLEQATKDLEMATAAPLLIPFSPLR